MHSKNAAKYYEGNEIRTDLNAKQFGVHVDT